MLGNVVLVFLVMTAFAFLVETLVEFALGMLFDKIPKITPYKWVLAYAAIAVGILGAFVYKFDVIFMLFSYLGVESWLGEPIRITIIGLIITGIAIGKGSNYLHDFLKKFFVKPSVENNLPSG
jgi:hypothetical protein